MAIYYTGVQVGNQVNFTTGDATTIATDVKQYFIDQSVTGGSTGTVPSNRAIYDFSTGISGYLYTNAGGVYQLSATSSGTDVAAINLTGLVSGTSYLDVIRVSGGEGVDLSVSNDIITLSHTDTSSVANLTVNASAGSAITGIAFTYDTYGHVLTATSTTAVIVRDQIQSGVTTTAPSEGSVHTLSGSLQTQINTALALNLQSVTNNGSVTTNGISIGGDLIVSGSTTLGNDASDSVTVKAGPVILEAATSASDALIFGLNDANKVSVYKSDPTVLRIDGGLIITGNLTVQGTTTTIDSNTISVGDSIVLLNGDFTGSAPSENAGIEVERGTQTNTSLLWNEGTDRWTFTNDGSTYYNIPITSELTLDATTTNGASTANDIIIGGLTVSGAAQAKSDHFVVYCSTSNGPVTEMFLNGTNGRIGIASNSAVSFQGQITAFDSANAKAASWEYKCLIANKGGNSAVVGSAHVLNIGDDSNGTWKVYVDADNTNDSLKLQVEGQASASIKWTASVFSSVVV
jgi:hypothetical protein